MKKLLSLGAKQFLSGIAPNAHTETGGLFFKADSVTPLYDAGGTASVENGLLQAGPALTDFTGAVVVDNIIAGDIAYLGSTPYLFMIGDTGHIYRKPVGSGAPVDVHTAAVNGANGVAVWAPKGGTKLLYYWQKTQIGTFDLTATYTDGVYTGLTGVAYHPVHQFNGNVYYGNVAKVGALLDNGAGSATHSSALFTIPAQLGITDLSDDGTYLVIAGTENLDGINVFGNNYIYFWDLHSSQWTREYTIRDPFIWSLQKMGNAVYAFGQYGIYEVSFAGVKKVLSRFIGFATPSNLISGYGSNRALVYNESSVMFGTDTTIDTFGRLSPDLANAYFKHFTGMTGTPTFISASLDVGRVYVGTTSSKLYAFDFNGTTRNTGVSAQTVYVPFGDKYQIDRVDVVFGEPLVTGDSMSIQLKTDEDTSASTAMVASHAQDGATRRKRFNPVGGFVVDEQLSIVVNFTAGAVKIKKIDVYGTRIDVNT